MTRAAARPSFPARGAPISLLVDFDGTISREDVSDHLLAGLVPDQDAVQHMDDLYLAGQVGSRELIVWDMDVLPRDPELLWRTVDDVGLDETIVQLIDVVRETGAAIEVVSDGTGFHVQQMLDRLDLGWLPIATNEVAVGAGGAGVAFPYGHPACHVCGTCKRERIRLHRAAGRAVIFVGDGPSDRYAAHHADVIFAKSSLATWCDQAGIAYRPWHRLADVADWLDRELSRGRLPATPDDFEAWAAGTRSADESFICGPEVWGPDRTVPVVADR